MPLYSCQASLCRFEAEHWSGSKFDGIIFALIALWVEGRCGSIFRKEWQMTKQAKASVCGNCQSFKLEKDKKFFNCLNAKHSGLKYGMQVRVDSQACEAFVAK